MSISIYTTYTPTLLCNAPIREAKCTAPVLDRMDSGYLGMTARSEQDKITLHACT
jgi:hypothetical protein